MAKKGDLLRRQVKYLPSVPSPAKAMGNYENRNLARGDTEWRWGLCHTALDPRRQEGGPWSSPREAVDFRVSCAGIVERDCEEQTCH